MKRVGVVVEGPSDRVFWDRFLGRTFARLGYVFEVRSMKGCSRIIQESSGLLDFFFKEDYHAALFIVDGDKLPCATAMLDQFSEGVRQHVRQQPPERRFANVFVALREIESWILADELCIQKLLELSDYRSTPSDSQAIGGKAKFLRLCKQQRLFLAGMEDLECARQAARLFDPERAASHSPSCAYFWNRLKTRLQAEPA